MKHLVLFLFFFVSLLPSIPPRGCKVLGPVAYAAKLPNDTFQDAFGWLKIHAMALGANGIINFGCNYEEVSKFNEIGHYPTCWGVALGCES